MPDVAKSGPEFTAAIRGYDRLQVDEYVEQLQRLLAEAEQRARTAEDDLEFSGHATIGPRVSQIFDLAVAESQELRQRVHGEADALLAEARENSAGIIAAAHQDDAEIRERTEQERQELIAEMERQRDAAREQLLALEQRRTKLVGELKRLHDALGSAAALVQEDLAGEADEVAKADTDGSPTRELHLAEDDAGEEDGDSSEVKRAAG